MLITDYKSQSSIPSRRLTKVAVTGLSPYQYVAGEDRLMYHAVAMAIDAISKAKGDKDKTKGSGLLDND